VLSHRVNQSPSCRARAVRTLLCAVFASAAGCQSIRNGWLDPTVLGNFEQTATLEIRESLTLEDMPRGVPGASYPWPEDLLYIEEEQAMSPGDQVAVEIYELRDRGVPFQAQLQVSATGHVNLPVIGRVHASGLSVSEFEETLSDSLIDSGVLLQPQVTVNPLFLQKATYSIFGVGVSAADNAPLRAGTFPIRRPDLRVLEAINLVGGLNEFVTEIYVFRNYVHPDLRPFKKLPPAGPGNDDEVNDQEGSIQKTRSAALASARGATPIKVSHQDQRRDPRRELIEAVVGQSEESPQQVQGDEEGAPPSLPPDFEPDPSLPYIWVDGEFVRNPAYTEPTVPRDAADPDPVPLDRPSPTVNWSRIAGDSAYRIIVIPADSLRQGDPEADIYVRPGDVIRIVSGEIGVYYVMGQVNRVGAFSFNAEPITLKAAIAAAGGLSSLAWPDRCTVYRRMGQREQMIQVDLDRIFAGKDTDFYIRRGDIINVGTHPFAPFLQRIRALTLPNPVNNVGYSFTYARNFADIDSYGPRVNPSNEPRRFPNLFP
jgi:protein involved in polysaccharide export with SLBB domain